METKTRIAKDFDEKSIVESREFNAPLENVWRAFTESELLKNVGLRRLEKSKQKQ